MSHQKGNFVDNIGRKKWDLEKFEQEARDLKTNETKTVEEKKKDVSGVRSLLKHREEKIDFLKDVGKETVYNGSTSMSNRAGYYCNICDCLLTDSVAYLNHINGKKHQKASGVSMYVEKVDVSRVASKLQQHVDKTKATTPIVKETITERLKRLEREADEKKRNKNRRRTDHNSNDNNNNNNGDDNEDNTQGQSKFSKHNDATESASGDTVLSSALLSSSDEMELAMAQQRAERREISVEEVDFQDDFDEDDEEVDEEMERRLAMLKGSNNESTTNNDDAVKKEDIAVSKTETLDVEEEDNADMMQMFGMSSFGGGKKR